MPDDVSITPLLWARTARVRDHAAESEAVRRIAEAIVTTPADVPHTSVAMCLAATGAASCGLYLLESAGDDERAVLLAAAGVAKHRFPPVIARYLSPCTVCIDTGEPTLLRGPGRIYPYLSAGAAIHEMLLVPLRHHDGRVLGALWIASERPGPAFDSGDVRFLELVATFVQIGLQACGAAATAAPSSPQVEALTLANVELGRVATMQHAASAASALAFAELEHRVKNVMHMTAAALAWEAVRTDDPHAIRALEGARRRVLAVGEIGRLTTTDGEVDVGDAIRELCAAVAGGDPRFSVEVAAAAVHAPGPAAAIVSLIANELITNAIKHAAAGPESLVAIGVSLSPEGPHHAVLTITDDGAPFTPVPGRSKGLGLKLVKGLASQLGGRLDINVAKKSFLVTFPTGRHAYAGVGAAPSPMVMAGYGAGP